MIIDKNKLNIIKFNGCEDKGKARDYILSQDYSSSKNYIRSIENNELNGYEDSFLIIYDNEIIGFFQIKSEDGLVDISYEPWLCRLFVDENYRGNRITEIVTNFAFNYCKEFGFDKIYLSTNHKGLYEKFSWKKIGSGISKSGMVRDIFEYSI